MMKIVVAKEIWLDETARRAFDVKCDGVEDALHAWGIPQIGRRLFREPRRFEGLVKSLSAQEVRPGVFRVLASA